MSRLPAEWMLLAALLGGAGSASAQGEKSKAAENLRPSGPVTVTADRAEWQKGGSMVYTGNVRLSSDTLELDGAKLELQQFPGGQYEAKVFGDPANLRHPGTTAADGEVEPPMSAQSKTLNYDTRSGIVEINGNATMTRGTDRISGDTIRYNVAERRVQAAGGSGGQVKIVIQPPPSKSAAPPTPKKTDG